MATNQQSSKLEESEPSKDPTKEIHYKPLAKRRCVSPSRHPYIQKNLDIFKETFQKPSQIYKFLKETWKTHPLYLNRTLSYISKHRSRTIKRKDDNIDSIAKRLHKNQASHKLENGKNGHKLINSSQNYLNGNSGKKCDNGNNITENNRLSNPSSSDNICYFNWICDDPSRTSQKTRSYGFACPWCERSLGFLDSLMAHLKCCHSRFNFNLVEEDGQSVIEMTLNPSFDGSYCGFKYPGHDLRRDFRFTPTYPERRVPLTQIIYFRAKMRQNLRSLDNRLLSLSSSANSNMFVYEDGEADIDVCSGRLYYHTSTCLPIKPNEVDIDSEADIDPDWLRERTQLMIDEFTDVNEGEKEILKLWNLHIMKNYKYKGDNMLPQACSDFVDSEGLTILSKNLYKNFTLHLANLFDFGLIGSQDILDCIRKLNKLRPSINSNSSKTSNKIKPERNSNDYCHHSSPAKRALINSHYLSHHCGLSGDIRMSLIVDSFKDAHEGFNWVEHELALIMNMIHLGLLFHYYLYETLAFLLSKLGYPQLPVVTYFEIQGFGKWLNPALKLMLLINAAIGFLGIASWRPLLTLISMFVSAPFIMDDLYLLLIGRFYDIKVDDFLLFQTLYATIIRYSQMITGFFNLSIIIRFNYVLPKNISFIDLL